RGPRLAEACHAGAVSQPGRKSPPRRTAGEAGTGWDRSDLRRSGSTRLTRMTPVRIRLPHDRAVRPDRVQVDVDSRSSSSATNSVSPRAPRAWRRDHSRIGLGSGVPRIAVLPTEIEPKLNSANSSRTSSDGSRARTSGSYRTRPEV